MENEIYGTIIFIGDGGGGMNYDRNPVQNILLSINDTLYNEFINIQL